MKRKGNLYDEICSIENLQLADKLACRGKGNQYGVKLHIENREENILALHELMVRQEYKTSDYKKFLIYEPKERLIYKLNYYPHRIVHYAVMNVIKPVLMSHFTADTYSCIEGRGIHGAARAVRKALIDRDGTQYCLKFDIRKFYPSINHRILKQQLQRKFKDDKLLNLLFGIIDSAEGLPIGNYLSQYLANFYLSGFDHWIKEVKRVKYYFRYADDIVILSPDKELLHVLFDEIKKYFAEYLDLVIKHNHQIFPVSQTNGRGIDFVGYVFYHTHTRLRKTIKKRFAKKMSRGFNYKSFASYYGWAKYCNGNHLIKKLISNEELQRFRNRSIRRNRKKIHGGQIINGSSVECKNTYNLLRYPSFEKQSRYRVLIPTGRMERREEAYYEGS